ncbi:MAG: SUMF1/EgtB/PvdO family nonheme iron enzyme [Polyangiales bacterium]
MRRCQVVVGLALALLGSACSGAVDDGEPNDEAGGLDGDAALDGALDAPSTDAPGGDTSFGETYAGGEECTVAGVLGECIDVSLCTGELVPTPGHCAGPSNIQCCTVRAFHDGGVDARPDTPSDAGWCPADPTARPNEGLVEAAGSPGCPAGMVAVSTFCVDRYEASIVVADASGKETSWSPYYPPPSDGRKYRAVSLRNAVPQGYVSGEQSQAACASSGKRLCTNTEWLRACRGPSGFTYPYGNTRRDGVCNDARSLHPAVQCFGTGASWIYSELDYAGIGQQADTVDRTGENAGCVTTDGLYDMMGNLHEWIYDDPSKYGSPVKAIDFRGGFYVDTKLNGEGCLYQTTAHTFGHWDYSTGFRCCADRS